MNYKIENASIEECIAFLKLIPEFSNPHKTKKDYLLRFEDGKNHLIKATTEDGTIVGVKVAYELTQSILYSWLGAVLPAYRECGIAKQLANEQEKWAVKKRFKKIRFKTLNRHKAMLLFAIKNGFHIIDVEPRDQRQEHRILLEKVL